MQILFWTVVGFFVGALAKIASPSNAPGGWIGDAVIGITGALVGGIVFYGAAGLSYTGLVGSMLCAGLGAIIFLSIAHAVMGRPQARQ